MAATDGQIVVAAARWSEEGSYLREFVSKQRLPAVVKIIKGQYGGLGVPTLPCPGLQSTALLVSAGRRHKIVAQAVKVKEGRRLAPVGPRLAIPDTYRGYFELLSEEGRAVRCLESVAELARRRPEAGCLVREPVRALAARLAPDGTTVTADGTRTLPAGELLVVLPPPPNSINCAPTAPTELGETVSGAKGRYLRCADSRGQPVLLSIDQRGRFSALAREDNISGVHTARNLLSKRMPMTVRLVHGTAPRGLKSPGHFVPELRLLSTFEEEHVFALPLQKEATHVTALPLAAPLKLLRTRNDEQLRVMPEFARLVDKCARLAADVADRIQVLDGKLGDSKRGSLPSGHMYQHQGSLPGPQPPPPASKGGYALRRSVSSDSANQRVRSHHHHRSRDSENRAPPSAAASEYDEIDQIYDYVRGFAPLPKNIRSPFSEPAPTPPPPAAPTSVSSHDPTVRPEPPPIETIPTKKLQAEKRNRSANKTDNTPTGEQQAAPQTPVPAAPGPQTRNSPPGLPKLYIKNGHSQRSRLLRQKSSSPLKEAPPSPLSKSGSPIFNIRYKSLSSLQQAMELDGGGTLDSSHSGGRRSGDSGGGKDSNDRLSKQPEKRSRRLSRPRSLTNLVWETREPPPPERHRHRHRTQPPDLPPPHLPPPVSAYKKSAGKYPLLNGAPKRNGTLYL